MCVYMTGCVSVRMRSTEIYVRITGRLTIRESVRIERKIKVFSIEKFAFSPQCGHAHCLLHWSSGSAQSSCSGGPRFVGGEN